MSAPKDSILIVNDPRIVTPTDPLFIDGTPAVFDNIVIQGGAIYVQVKSDVTIHQLSQGGTIGRPGGKS